MALALILPGCGPGMEINSPKRVVAQKPMHQVEIPGAVLRGRVVWKGPLPAVEGFLGPISSLSEHGGGVRLPWANPNAPRIQGKTKCIENAVVFLADEGASHPSWTHPPVAMVTDKFRLQVEQGEYTGPIGFLPRAGAIQLENRQDFFFLIRGRGENYFSLPLLIQGKPLRKTLEKPGITVLTSGSGQFWMRSYLFVTEHPWIARTNAAGEFEIPGLPAGKHHFKLWLPNWQVLDREIDAETWEINRLEFAPAMEKSFFSNFTGSKAEEVRLEASLDDFPKATPKPRGNFSPLSKGQ